MNNSYTYPRVDVQPLLAVQLLVVVRHYPVPNAIQGGLVFLNHTFHLLVDFYDLLGEHIVRNIRGHAERKRLDVAAIEHADVQGIRVALVRPRGDVLLDVETGRYLYDGPF